MEFYWNLSTKCIEMPQTSIATNPSLDVIFFSKIYQATCSNQKMVKSVINCLGFYLSPEWVVEFSLTCIFHHMQEKILKLWCSRLSKMHWLYLFLLMPQLPIHKFRKNFLKICLPEAERVGENCDLLYQNSIRKYGDDLEH